MINDSNLKLKEQFLEYFLDVPIQKYAAAVIGRDENTITRWKTEDVDFSDQINVAKARFLQTNLKRVRSKEWTIERLFKDHFSPPKQEVENSGEIKHIIITEEESE